MTSATSTATPTVRSSSKFAVKAGFVIPKNKLSGSLVPIFKGGKAKDSADAGEPANQANRKAKWGPDLTEDVFVRRGRALAYQTRVDQITKQLGSGVLEPQWNENSQIADQHVDTDVSSLQVELKNPKLLELEQREAIGEILQLNPNRKAPPDYKPLLKEGRVPIPVKKYPGYNFIGLIFGPANETRNRLEKETGAKIQVFGRKSNTEQKVEISPSDQSETQSTYEELIVNVSADTFDKVDAAVSLIELLLSSVSEKLESADDINVLNQRREVHMVGNQGLMPHTVGATISEQSQFQYQNPSFPAITPQAAVNPTPSLIPPQTSSGLILSNPANSHSSPYDPSTMSSSFGPSPAASGFSSVLQNPSLARPQQPVQVLSNPYPPANFSTLASQPLVQTNVGRQHSTTVPFPAVQPPSVQANVGSQHSLTGVVARPLLPQLPTVPRGPNMASPMAPSPGNLVPRPGFPSLAPLMNVSAAANIAPSVSFPSGPPTLLSSSVPNHLAGARNAAFPTQIGPFSTSTPIQSSIPPNAFSNLSRHPLPMSSALTPVSQPTPQFGNVGPFSGIATNFSAIRSPMAAAARPQHSGPGDFTFQPHHLQNPASQSVPRLNSQPATQSALPRHMMQPSGPEAPSFQMPVRNSTPQTGMHVLARPPIHNEMNQSQAHMPGGPFAGNPPRPAVPPRQPAFPNVGPLAPSGLHMRSRNFGATPQPPDVAGHFPPRPGNLLHSQQNYPPAAPHGQFMGMSQPFMKNASFASGRPGNPGQQVYDPFSPTVSNISQQRVGNIGKGSKQENDPEYEDLMASVGVK